MTKTYILPTWILFMIVLYFPFTAPGQDIPQSIMQPAPGNAEVLHPTAMSDTVAIRACNNDNFANATNIAVGTTLVNETACGSIEAGEKLGCNTGGGAGGATAVQTVWYSFTATALTTYVVVTYSGGLCYVGSAVWSGFPSSGCKQISCQNPAGGQGPNSSLITTIHQLNTVIGTVYYVQVTYSGGACGASATFNIQVTNATPGGQISNPPPSNTCATGGPGCVFPSAPTVPQVTTNCPGYALPSNLNNKVTSGYYTFTTGPTNCPAHYSFQNIIQSTCVGGNVNWLNWQLLNTSCNCITAGDLSNLALDCLGCNTTYTLKYMWEGINCSYSMQWPYQYNTGILCTLPITLVGFTGTSEQAVNTLYWKTETEINTNHFEILRSSDGTVFEYIGSVSAVGTSTVEEEYSFNDILPLPENYYRLKSVGSDGSVEYSNVIFLSRKIQEDAVNAFPNPFGEELQVSIQSQSSFDATLSIVNTLGVKMFEQKVANSTEPIKITFDTRKMREGVYYLVMTRNHESRYMILIKE